jgi:hypothetical protein
MIRSCKKNLGVSYGREIFRTFEIIDEKARDSEMTVRGVFEFIPVLTLIVNII